MVGKSRMVLFIKVVLVVGSFSIILSPIAVNSTVIQFVVVAMVVVMRNLASSLFVVVNLLAIAYVHAVAAVNLVANTNVLVPVVVMKNGVTSASVTAFILNAGVRVHVTNAANLVTNAPVAKNVETQIAASV